jgi:hypothetical protein
MENFILQAVRASLYKKYISFLNLIFTILNINEVN